MRVTTLFLIGLLAQRTLGQCSFTGTSTLSANCSVGVGSSSAPADVLHVRGSQPAIRVEDTGSSSGALRFFTNGAERLSLQGENDGSLRVKTRDANGSLTDKFVVLGNGNAAVGWSTPGFKFVVMGRIYSAGETDTDGFLNFMAEYGGAYGTAASPGVQSLRMTSNHVTAAAVGFMPYDANNAALRFFTKSNGVVARRMTIEPDGRVGISGSLIVGGEGSAAGGNRLVLGAAAADYGYVGYNVMGSATTPGQFYPMASSDYASQIHFAEGGLKFRTTNSLPFTMNQPIPFIDAMTISRDGKVGIRVASPQVALDVAGDIRATGSITGATVVGAVYQDVAEWVPATNDLAAGTVVVLNGSHNNEVTASTKSYDTRVAGVVSAQPGLILGVGGESKEMIATTGRVRVLVDATNAPIEIGDLLVTSEQTGRAMKSAPVAIGGVEVHRPGTIVGKALEPLQSGTGEILVLLSLQ
jgi:hypothetical protein